MRKILFLLLPLILLAAAPAPLLPCYGPAVECSLHTQPFIFNVTWDGEVCLVRYETVAGYTDITGDIDGDYIVQGFGTQGVYISARPDVSPIQTVQIYYNILTKRVYVPMVVR